MRRRWIISAAALVVLVLLAAQVALPRLGEGAVEDRLTEGGGDADVSLSAVPAVRLLWGSGDRLAISGRRLELPLSGSGDGGLEQIGGFGEVEIDLAEVKTGPFELDELTMRRPTGGEPFRLVVRGSFTPADAAQLLDLPGAELGELLLDRSGLGASAVPIDVSFEFAIDDGRLELRGGSTTISGVPAGPIVEALAGAISARV